YVSSNKIFIVTYPSDWKTNNQETAEFCINAPGANIFKICMVKMEINKMAEGYEKYNIKQLSEVELKMFKATQDASATFDVLSSDFKNIKDQEWWMLKGKYTKRKEVFYTNSYKTIHSGKVYVFTYFSREKDFEKNEPDATKIFDSIEFLTKNEPNNK
ncbi:MAG: hypothetical protein ABJB86_14920, partial [Bacteroidota bacterium]